MTDPRPTNTTPDEPHRPVVAYRPPPLTAANYPRLADRAGPLRASLREAAELRLWRRRWLRDFGRCPSAALVALESRERVLRARARVVVRRATIGRAAVARDEVIRNSLALGDAWRLCFRALGDAPAGGPEWYDGRAEMLLRRVRHVCYLAGRVDPFAAVTARVSAARLRSAIRDAADSYPGSSSSDLREAFVLLGVWS